jgi:hypothetical protein
MGFGWPLGLATLAALVVPLLIHLARRRPRRPVLVGTLRHLPARTPRRARSRIVEPWLLALRMLILALLAFVTAGAYIRSDPPAAAPRALLALPVGLSDDSLRRLLPGLDSLMAGREVHRLPMADLWSELGELDATLPSGSSIHVVAPLALPVSGARPALASTITLHRFEGNREIAGPAHSRRVLPVRIVADPSSRIAAWRHEAAFHAVAELRGDSLVLGDAEMGGDGWIVWLADSAPSPGVLEEVRAGATLLLPAAGSRPAGDIAIEPIGRGRIFTAPGIRDPAVDAAFPELIARIWPTPASLAPARLPVLHVSTTQLLPAGGSGPRRPGAPRTPLDRVLLAAALVAFLLERWLSSRPIPARAT